MSDFIKALELSEQFYEKIVAPILKTHFPDLEYSAALIGWGSEVLGFDDAQSTDHNYGLRFQVFLTEKDFDEYSSRIDHVLKKGLPDNFHGFPTAFEIVANDDDRGKPENLRHHVDLETIAGFFRRYLDCDPYEDLKAADWLAFPEHKLLAVTSGRVFFDGSGNLEDIRKKFAYFPRDVWLYMLAAQWSKIFEEQAFVGRCGQLGDELGSTLIAARQIKNLMRLAFLIERKYAPYSKWFGTAFSHLRCAGDLKPVFEKTMDAKDWHARQRFLTDGCKIIMRHYNDLRITCPMSEEISDYFKRPFLVIKDESVVDKLLAEITDEEVKNIRKGLGSVNQFFDSNAQLNDASLIRELKMLYQ